MTAPFPLLCLFAWPHLPPSSNLARTFLLNFPYSQDFELQNGTSPEAIMNNFLDCRLPQLLEMWFPQESRQPQFFPSQKYRPLRGAFNYEKW